MHASDFYFGNIELMPSKVTQIILEHLVSPHVTHQQMCFAELLRVTETISYARENKICHGEFDRAELHLEVDYLNESSGTFYTEYYCPDSE